MRQMVTDKLMPHIAEGIRNGSIKPGIIAQLLIERSCTNHLNNCFHRYSAVYRQTNEPIRSYLADIDLQNKDALSVAGSGDFLLSLINKGARNIETFDISLFTKFYQEMKFSALKALNYEEFIRFFYGDNCFDDHTYGLISNYFSDECLEFWDSLFDFYDAFDIINSSLFMQQNISENRAIRNNSYLASEEEYELTKKSAKKTNFCFHNLDILKSPVTIQRKFDIILVSNIYDYSLKVWNSFDEFVNELRSKFKPMLKENGTIISTSFVQRLKDIKRDDWSLEEIEDGVKVLKIHKK